MEISRISVNEAEVSLNSEKARQTKAASCPVDLADVNCTPKEKEELRRLLLKHADVFVQEGDELGYTETYKHRIPTTDDIPVSQPFGRIPPTQVPPEIATASQDGNCLDLLERQAVSFIPGEEIEKNPAQAGKKPSEQIPSTPKVSTTSSFPQYSRDDLANIQFEDPSIKEFLKYWTANRNPNTRERSKLPRKTFTLLKQWDRMQKEDGLLW